MSRDIDIITLTEPVGAELDEKDISWPSDRNAKFLQVDGFKSVYSVNATTI